jgi:hypothetical protein
MKRTTEIIISIAALAVSTFAGGLWAQVPAVMTITAKGQQQNPGTLNGNISIYPAPVLIALDTKEILSWLAFDESQEGKYATSTFPTGAKLVIILGHTDRDSIDFQVVDSTGGLLVDVSDIMGGSYTGTFGGSVFSGKQDNTTLLGAPSINSMEVFTLHFDDTNIIFGMRIRFSLEGLLNNTITDSATSAKTGLFTETQILKMTDVGGDGNYLGYDMVVSGSMTAEGSASEVAALAGPNAAPPAPLPTTPPPQNNLPTGTPPKM